MQRRGVRALGSERREIARVEVRAMLIRFMKKIADANRTFQREGSIQRTPGKGERTRATGFRFITTAGMTDAGKFTFERAPIGPVFRMCYKPWRSRRLEEIGSHIFVC